MGGDRPDSADVEGTPSLDPAPDVRAPTASDARPDATSDPVLEPLLEALLAAVDAPAALLDGARRVRIANAALASVAGAAPSDLVGEPVTALPLVAVEEQHLPGGGWLVRAAASTDGGGEGSPESGRDPAAAVNDAAQALAEAVTVAHVTAVIERQLPAFGASGLLISLNEGPRLRLVSSRGYPDEVVEMLRDQALDGSAPMAQVVRERRPTFLGSWDDYVRGWPQRESLARATGKQAWAFLPLLAAGRAIGCWCLSWDRPHRFGAHERALLATLSGLVAQAVARAQAVDAERDLARSLQRSLLPSTLPAVPGGRVAVRYSPAVAGLQVGGDFYDVVPLPRGGAGLVVGDAAGHSAEAAALMGQARSAVRAYAAEGHDAASVLMRANRFLVTAGTGSFVTCTYVSVDPAGEHLVVARAGHPAPLLLGSDGARWLDVAGGLPLGVDRGATYPVTTVSLRPGDRLVLVTDGLVESRLGGPEGGAAALAARAEKARELPLEDFADVVLADGGEEDDVALLVLERTGEGAVPRRRQAAWSLAPAAPVEVGRVRREVAQQLDEWQWSPRRDELLLVLSELLTNAVRHVGGRVDVLLTDDGDELLVAVDDRSPAVPMPRSAAADATGGRGLAVVRAVADRWGVEPQGAGKTVWAALQRPAGGTHDDNGDGGTTAPST